MTAVSIYFEHSVFPYKFSDQVDFYDVMTDKKRKDPNEVLHSLKFRGISGRELHALLTQVKEAPELLDKITTGNVNIWGARALRAAAAKMQTMDLQLWNGGSFAWSFFSLSKLVALHAKQNPIFASVLKQVLSERAGQPLNIIVYSDEVVPGNVIKPDNRRKLVQWYVSFVEFRLHLRNERVWLPVAALRSSMIQDIAGGLSAASRALFHSIVHEEDSLLKGTAVEIPDPMLVTGRLSVFVGDESALKHVWAVMGASGVKTCFCCTNVVKKGNPLLSVCPDVVSITETDFSKCWPATKEDLWRAQDDLARQAPTFRFKSELKALQTACGQNFCPNGVLADTDLRQHVNPLGSQFDTMHCYFSGGVAEVEIELVLQVLQKLDGLDSNVLQQFCNTWLAHYRPHVTLKDFSFKGMASQVVYVIPILRYFLEKFCSNNRNMSKEVDSFRALHDVVRCLARIKKMAVVPATATRELADLQQKHFQRFQDAYSAEDHTLPKHHYSLRVPQQIDRHSFLIDCFVLERKHQLVKAEVQNMRQIASNDKFELSVVAHLNDVQLAESNRTEMRPCLANPKQIHDGLAVSKTVHLTFMDVKAKDIIYSDGRAYLVHGCSSSGNQLELLVEMFCLVEQLYPGARKWKALNTFWKLQVKVSFTRYFRRCAVFFLFLELILMFCRTSLTLPLVGLGLNIIC